MTNDERDELLIRIDERLKDIREDLKHDYKILHGNGQPGLISKVQALEDQHKSESKHLGIIAGIIAWAITTITAFYAAVFKQ